MATHPMTGRFVAIESILGLNLDFFDKITFVSLAIYENNFKFKNGFLDELSDLGLLEKSSLLLLDAPTNSQPETVAKAIELQALQGFIFVKDADGFFKANITDDGNQVAFMPIEKAGLIDAGSKSYLKLDINGILTNIVEKKVISSEFCVGGYGFASATEYLAAFKEVGKLQSRIYLSHVIFEMLLAGTSFVGLEAENFLDWGDSALWRKFCSEYKCLFVDIDGTLVTNSSAHFEPSIGSGVPLSNNIELLQELHRAGKARIILTTSRHEKFREITLQELIAKQIPFDDLLMGLPHCQRVLINDFAKSNAYPSCAAINLPRDEDSLKNYLNP